MLTVEITRPFVCRVYPPSANPPELPPGVVLLPGARFEVRRHPERRGADDWFALVSADGVVPVPVGRWRWVTPAPVGRGAIVLARTRHPAVYRGSDRRLYVRRAGRPSRCAWCGRMARVVIVQLAAPAGEANQAICGRHVRVQPGGGGGRPRSEG